MKEAKDEQEKHRPRRGSPNLHVSRLEGKQRAKSRSKKTEKYQKHDNSSYSLQRSASSLHRYGRFLTRKLSSNFEKKLNSKRPKKISSRDQGRPKLMRKSSSFFNKLKRLGAQEVMKTGNARYLNAYETKITVAEILERYDLTLDELEEYRTQLRHRRNDIAP